MSKSDFLPASELAGYETERIHWEVELPPYAPAEAIGINIKRLGKFAHGGGFGQLVVVNYAGEVTEFTPTVDSVNAQGGATASMKATMQKASMAEVDTSHDRGRFASQFYEYHWSQGTLKLNMSEITEKLMRSKQPGALRDPSEWAKQINAATREGIRKAATENLLTNLPAVQRQRLLITEAIFAATSTLTHFENPGEILTSVLETNLIYQFFMSPLLNSLMYKLPFSQRRFSFVPNLQMDRVLAVNGLSRVLTLAKKI